MGTLGRGVLDAVAVAVTKSLFRIHASGLEHMPRHGPFLLISNHVTGFEFPVLRTLLRPRRIRTLAKAESWEHRLLGWMLDQWESIPIKRGESDMAAFRTSLKVLADGGILGIMPEGTRSHDGKLARANPGVSLLALKSHCPIIPMAFWGIEHVLENAKRLRRTDFHFRVGKAFTLTPTEGKLGRSDRQQIADVIMRHVADLMPPKYQGVYQEES